MQLAVSIVVRQPVERVFEETTSSENFARWNPDILEPRWVCGVPNTLGARFEAKMRGFWGRQHPVQYEIVEWAPPRRHAVRLMSPPFAFKGVLELTPVAEGTLLTNVMCPDWDFPFVATCLLLASPLLYFPMRWQMRQILERMKTDIEAKYGA